MSVCVSVCVLCACACACVCVCVCVCVQDNAKRNQSQNMKLEYTVVYENSSGEFNIEHHPIKVKVTVGFQRFFPFTIIQTVRSYNSIWYKLGSLYYSCMFI